MTSISWAFNGWVNTCSPIRGVAATLLRPARYAHARWSAALAWLLLLTGAFGASTAVANGDRLYLDCPCEIESDGSTLSITAGVRSFRPTASGPLSLHVERRLPDHSARFFVHVADVVVADSLPGGAKLETATFVVPIESRPMKRAPWKSNWFFTNRSTNGKTSGIVCAWRPRLTWPTRSA